MKIMNRNIRTARRTPHQVKPGQNLMCRYRLRTAEKHLFLFFGGGALLTRGSTLYPSKKKEKKKLRKNESATLRKISCVLGKEKISFFV